jgi:Flp pilus assembly protein TadD
LYTHWGLKNYQEGDLGSAQEQFKRALQLNPDDNDAHFWLGSLYEDLQNVDDARTQYLFAMQRGKLKAVNNLARLQILKKNYPEAVALLLKALDSERKQSIDLETKHAILKNLGWARFNQNDYAGAEAYLSEAIDLQKTDKLTKNIAAPHCLLAQVKDAQVKNKQVSTKKAPFDKRKTWVKEIQDNEKKALIEWDICNKEANGLNSDEDGWRITAQQRLTSKEDNK